MQQHPTYGRPQYPYPQPYPHAGHRGPGRRRRPSLAARMVRVLAVLAGVALIGSVVLPQLNQLVEGSQSAFGNGGSGAGSGLVPEPDGRAGTGSDDGPDTSGSDLGTGPAATQLQDNVLYTVGGVPAIDCPAPVLPDASPASQQAYDEQLFDCLITGWTGLLDQAGLSTTPPSLFVFDSAGTGPCGSFSPRTGRILAFYCPANETMYADAAQMAAAFPPEHHIAYALVLAHEYGHHLQFVAGILEAERQLAYEEPARTNELSRRTETQASCFAGMFIRGVEASYPIEGEQQRLLAQYAYGHFGDAEGSAESDRTHGNATSQGTWIERGFAENDTGACDTYSAPTDAVD